MAQVERIPPEALEDALGLLDAFLEAIGEPIVDEAARMRIRRAQEEGRIEFLVAKEDGRPVGLCSLTYGYSTYKAAAFALLEDYFVAPSHRGQGVARQVVEAAAARATAKGCRSLIAGVSQGDLEMWEHYGFRSIGVMVARDLGTD